MLHVNDITYRIGSRVLLDHATVALQDGSKTGLVGRNGSGKTTLFRLITGELTPETGSISLPRNARVGQVAQEAPSSEDLAAQVAGIATAKFDSLVPQPVLRTLWAQAHAGVVALLPELAAGLLATAGSNPGRPAVSTSNAN